MNIYRQLQRKIIQETGISLRLKKENKFLYRYLMNMRKYKLLMEDQVKRMTGQLGICVY